MTRREVFIKVNPHAVHEALGYREIEIKGETVMLRSERPFEICKGLGKFARGCKYEDLNKNNIQEILTANGESNLSFIHSHIAHQSALATTMITIEALGFNNISNVDQQIQECLDH